MFTLPPLIWWGLPYGVVQVVQVVHFRGLFTFI